MTQKLFFSLRLGSLDLKHRVVMAPVTRMRAAQPGNVPQALNVEYYRQRARRGADLNAYTRATFYGGGAEGYVDYPALQASSQ